MKRPSNYLLLLLLIALVAGSFGFPSPVQAKFDPNGTDVLSSCTSGTCGGGGGAATAGSGASVSGAAGPVKTAPGIGQAVNVTNPWIGIASPVLNAIAKFTGLTLGQKKFEWGQSFILEALKKRVLDLLVAEIIQWVQGDGTPKFITNWEQFLGDAANVAAGDFAQYLKLGDLCSPFRGQVENFFGGYQSRQINLTPITCTLDDIVGNIEDFYNDFSQGGWLAYQESWKPQNNLFGSYILAKSSQVANIESAQEAAKLQGLAGRGYPGEQTCFEITPPPGTTSKDPSLGPDLDGDGDFGDIQSTCDITTPGATIGDLVGKAVGSDIDFIVNAPQLSTYVAAIADALFNRLIREGVSGLQGLTTNDAPSRGYIGEPTGLDRCSDLPSQDLIGACQTYFDSNTANFNGSRQDALDDVNAVKTELIALKTALVAWKTVTDNLYDFLVAEAPQHPSVCIPQALRQYFTDPTIEGVAAYSASIASQITAVDQRLATLETYLTQLTAAKVEDWTNFTTLATTIENQLTTLVPPSDAVDNANLEKKDLEDAVRMDIKPDVLSCR